MFLWPAYKSNQGNIPENLSKISRLIREYILYFLSFLKVEEALEFADVIVNETDGRKITKYTHPDKELELKANTF